MELYTPLTLQTRDIPAASCAGINIGDLITGFPPVIDLAILAQVIDCVLDTIENIAQELADWVIDAILMVTDWFESIILAIDIYVTDIICLIYDYVMDPSFGLETLIEDITVELVKAVNIQVQKWLDALIDFVKTNYANELKILKVIIYSFFAVVFGLVIFIFLLFMLFIVKRLDRY